MKYFPEYIPVGHRLFKIEHVVVVVVVVEVVMREVRIAEPEIDRNGLPCLVFAKRFGSCSLGR